MKPEPVTISLTPENSKGITKLAALIGCIPERLANEMLAETLKMFADQNSSTLKGFFGTIY
jgi:hypothetical protein